MMGSSCTLGSVIRTRRLQLGLTQEELAARIGDGVRQSEVSRLERDRIMLPRRERLERIANAIQMPIGELLAQSGWAGADLTWGNGLPVHEPARDDRPIETARSTSIDRLRKAMLQAQFNCAQTRALLAEVSESVDHR